jgi:hypothetical protein
MLIRLVLYALGLIVAHAQGQAAQAITDADNVQCVVRLQMPTYPPLARQAQVQGTVETIVVLGADGALDRIDTTTHVPVNERVGRILSAPVEAALRKAQYRRECANKRIPLVFHFSITGDPNDRQQHEVEYGYPNNFWITTRPLLFQPSAP